VIRPTAGAFALAGLAYVLLNRRKRWVPFIVGACIGLSPGLAWNMYAFHSALGGYGLITDSYRFSFGPIVGALSGLMVSPSKGLLIYSPFVVFSVVSAIRAAKSPTLDARLLTCLTAGAVLTVANYACFERWIGGTCYGPRYLTDISCVASLLLMYAFPRGDASQRRYQLAIATFTLMLCYAIAV